MAGELSEANKPRVEYIDLFRSFGIILMIMGHIKFGSYFDKWIHAFHMPMFFFVSGWFFRSRDDVAIGTQIKNKAKSLLRPYVCFEIVQWLILMLFVSEYRTGKTILYIFLENTYKIPIENGTFGISPIPGAMWFLTAIFFTEVIYISLDRIFGCNWKLHGIVIVLSILGVLFPSLLPMRLPWAMDAAFVGIGFFHAARLIHGSRAEKLLNLKLWQTLLLGVVFSLFIMICPKINMRTGNYGWYLPFWINALGAIVVGWNMSRYVDKFLSKYAQFVGCWLKGIGKNSIVYLCFNQIVILTVTKILYLIGLSGFYTKIPVLIFTMIILFGCEKLICCTKLKILIGK